MICPYCGKQYHICSSCGIGEYDSDGYLHSVCSEKCARGYFAKEIGIVRDAIEEEKPMADYDGDSIYPDWMVNLAKENER